MKNDEVLGLLEANGAVIRDSHVVYTSGRHGSAYVNKDAIYTRPRAVSRLCHALAAEYRDRDVEVVVAPAIGGVILSMWTALHLNFVRGYGSDILAAFAERRPDGGSFEFRRGYDKLIACRDVLVVEDVITTGGTLRAVIRAALAAGGVLVGVACLVNRGGVEAADIGSPAPLFSLATIDLDYTYDPADCPLCRAGIPINTEVGKGREFLARGGR